MEKTKLALGLVLLPFAYILFICDRIITVLTPQSEHPAFMVWLKNESVIYAVVRLLTILFLWWMIEIIF